MHKEKHKRKFCSNVFPFLSNSDKVLQLLFLINRFFRKRMVRKTFLWSSNEILHLCSHVLRSKPQKPYEFLFICYLAYQSVCHNCIWFCQFPYGFFPPALYQFAANLGFVWDVSLEGFARIKRTQARWWQSHLFATIVRPSMDRCWFRCFDRFLSKICLPCGLWNCIRCLSKG